MEPKKSKENVALSSLTFRFFISKKTNQVVHVRVEFKDDDDSRTRIMALEVDSRIVKSVSLAIFHYSQRIKEQVAANFFKR